MTDRIIRISTTGRKQTVEILRDTVVLIRAALGGFRRMVTGLESELMQMARGGYGSDGAAFPIPQEFVDRLTARILTLSEILTAAQVAGILYTQRAAKTAGADIDPHFSEFPDDVPPLKAIKALKDSDLVTKARWEALSQANRQKAFFITGIEQRSILGIIRDAVSDSLQKGWTLKTFENVVRGQIEDLAISGGHLRTVWHMNVSNQFRKGRYDELAEPEVRSVLRYFLFDALVDQVTRPNHKALENGIAPTDWEGWSRYADPLGFNCRCQRIAITEGRALRMIESGEGWDLTAGVPAEAGMDPGFVRI